jgi:sugar lactone lactonase YvrE
MKFDRDGNLFASGPGGLQIFAPDGTHLGGIEFDGRVSNCKWGDDGSVLYIMANMRSTASKRPLEGQGGNQFSSRHAPTPRPASEDNTARLWEVTTR